MAGAEKVMLGGHRDDNRFMHHSGNGEWGDT